ncbi:MAG: antitoxin component YwqK of YwqJK toxin-antitoxin module [Parvicellaceae bacterium]|jgi:antitoxin component YwqK of YwqJK toxin-antitoxin module
MKRAAFLITVIFTSALVFSQSKDTLVLKKYTDGKPQVVVFFKIEDGLHKKVKENVYYSNGNLNYSGEVLDGVEHGKWEHYYEDGTKLSEGNYLFGRENGSFKTYYPDGRLAESSTYNMGIRKKHKTFRKRVDSSE